MNEYMRVEHMVGYEGRCSGGLAEAKLGVRSSFQQAFTVPGSGDPGEQAGADP